MKTLEHQLADYFMLQDEAYGPISPSEVSDPTVVPGVVGRPGRTVVLVAAFGFVLVAIGALSFLIASDGGEVIDDPTVTTVVDEPTLTTVTGELGDTVPFRGRTFSVDDQGPSETPYRLVELSDTGEWTPVEGFSFEQPMSIAASVDQLMVVSPSASAEFAMPCGDVVVHVAVSGDGEAWHRTSLNDVDRAVREQDPTPDRTEWDCFTRGGNWVDENDNYADSESEGRWVDWSNGGDAVGPTGMLVVRVITRCCVDPALFPHFWYSPDGLEWQRAELPYALEWSPYDGSGEVARWGEPSASIEGFAVSSEFLRGESWEAIETWGSPDGLMWSQIETGG